MEETNISRSAGDLIYLVACALHNTAPEEAVTAGMDFDALYSLAQNHSLAAIACMGLEKGNALSHCSPELARKWREAKEKAIRKNLILDSERQKLLSELEKNGIWYMPLKGAVLKDLYPKLGMREMADHDILFDASRAEEVRQLFEKQGYVCQSFGVNHHDNYQKPPVMEFEMHRTLFDAGELSGGEEKYQDVKSRLLPSPGTEYGLRFSDEDFYVYIIAHAYKHFAKHGIGLRTLVDYYVYNRKKGAALNWEYVHSELEDMGLADYEGSSRQLANKLFSVPEPKALRDLSEEEKELLDLYLGSGASGSMSVWAMHRIKDMQEDGKPIRKRTKVKYLFSRIFPGRKKLQRSHPFLYRNPWCIPFYWGYRIVHMLFRQGGKRHFRELRMILRLH